MHKSKQETILDKIIKGLIIEDYSLDIFTIKADWYTSGDPETKVIEINRELYEAWLKESAKLAFCNDFPGDSNIHMQHTGELSIDEYWEHSDLEERFAHLKEYLVKHYDPMTDSLKDHPQLSFQKVA